MAYFCSSRSSYCIHWSEICSIVLITELSEFRMAGKFIFSVNGLPIFRSSGVFIVEGCGSIAGGSGSGKK